MLTRAVLLVLVALAALAALAGSATAAGGGSLTVVASGLDNPRGLDVGPGGTIYVTEAGRGGNGPCTTGPDESAPVCVGATGAVTRVWHGHQSRIATGLPSLADATGAQASGPQDIDVRGFGFADLVVGLGANPAVRADLGPLGPGFGRLYRLWPFGHLRPSVDVSAYEAEQNPDGGEVDSNPNSVLRRGAGRIVADAGGNDLLRVGPTGRISTLAVFPDRLVSPPPGIPDLPPEIPMQAVPTSTVVGPDGAVYVGQLTGFPFLPGAARIYRVVPGHAPEVFADGFTNVTDLAFGPDGSLYVVEFAKNGLLSGDPAGALIRVAPDGTRETVASDGLVAPTGVAVDRAGHVYVSNHGASAGDGEVVRVSADH